jgi:hypothetical protein
MVTGVNSRIQMKENLSLKKYLADIKEDAYETTAVLLIMSLF